MKCTGNAIHLHYMSIRITIMTVMGLLFMEIPNVSQAGSLRSDLKIEFFIHQGRNTALEPDERIACYDSLLMSTSDDEERVVYMMEQAAVVSCAYGSGKAMEIYAKACELLDDDNDLKNIAMLEYAGSCLWSGNYKECIESSFSLIEKEKIDSFRWIDVEGWSLLGSVSAMLDDLEGREQCIKKAREAYNILKESGASDYRLKKSLSNILLMMGSYEIDNNNNRKALEYMKKLYDLWPDSSSRISSLGNLGKIYMMSGEYGMAERFLKEALDIPYRHYNKSAIAINYVENLRLWDKADSALRAADRYSGEISMTKESPWEIMHCMNMAYIYKAVGDKDKALDFMEKAFVMKDSLSAQYNSLYLREVKNAYNRRKKDYEKSVLSGKGKGAIFTIDIVMMLVAGVIVLIVIVLIMRKRSAKTSGTDMDVSDDYEAQAKIDSLKLCMEQMKSALDMIESEASALSSTNPELSARVKGVMRQLSSGTSVLDTVRRDGLDSENELYTKLQALHPELTKTELKMCRFIFMNMDNKQIAVLTNRSPNTIKCIKHNIRKKLGITEPTETYLRNIMGTDTSKNIFVG